MESCWSLWLYALAPVCATSRWRGCRKADQGIRQRSRQARRSRRPGCKGRARVLTGERTSHHVNTLLIARRWGQMNSRASYGISEGKQGGEVCLSLPCQAPRLRRSFGPLSGLAPFERSSEDTYTQAQRRHRIRPGVRKSSQG